MSYFSFWQSPQAGAEASCSVSSFSGTAGSLGYYVLQASRASIVSNAIGTQFNPDQGITREQALVILSKAIRYSGITLDTNGPALNTFTDANDVNSSFRSAIESLTKGGIVLGSKNKLNPKGIATRAQAALLVYRASIKLTN